MYGIFAKTYLYSLQTVKYFKDDDPTAPLQFGIVIGAIIVVSLTFTLIRSKSSKHKAKRAITGFAPRRMFSRFTLAQIASSYDLDREQKRFLDFVLRNEGTSDPIRLIQNAESLDRVFKNALKIIERSSKGDDHIQRQTSKLYALRNIMEEGLEDKTTSGGAPSQRRFKRKQIHTACTIYIIHVRMERKGAKRVAKLILKDKKGYKGSIQDISVGGCAINTSAPVLGDSTLKIDFHCAGDSSISVLGQVVRSNRSASTGTVIHVKFLKVPRRAYNEINSLIFGYYY